MEIVVPALAWLVFAVIWLAQRKQCPECRWQWAHYKADVCGRCGHHWSAR